MVHTTGYSQIVPSAENPDENCDAVGKSDANARKVVGAPELSLGEHRFCDLACEAKGAGEVVYAPK